MKIGIVTVYDATDNVGSYLQAYALMRALQQQGHSVCFLQHRHPLKMLCRLFRSLRPWRSLLLRVKRACTLLAAWCHLPVLKKSCASAPELLIYGSDEIWNMDNPYFRHPFFFGSDVVEQRKIAYAISVGEMKEETLRQHLNTLAFGIRSFSCIAPRDAYTARLLREHVALPGLDEESRPVCDPTLLVPLEELSQRCTLPKQKYLLVYTYGLDETLISHIRRFADQHQLLVVSVHFWHIWADRVVNASPFHLAYLMEHAEYVFSTTFHGSIFALRTHSRCAICPGRYKIRHLLEELACMDRCIDKECSYESFEHTIMAPFNGRAFEEELKRWRSYSQAILNRNIAQHEQAH